MLAAGRRSVLAAPLLLWPGAAAAQAAVTLIAGTPPGSAADLWIRGFAVFLERHWPRTAIQVVSRPGEGGLVAARAVAAAAPDGRLIAAVATPVLLARAVERGEEAVLAGLHFVAAVTEEPLLLLGHPGTAGEFAALRAIGAGAILGAPPAGSAAQLVGRGVARLLGLDLLAFANAAAARGAVVAGTIPCAMLAAPEAMPALRDDRLVVLGVAQARRSPLFPDVPTLSELGLPVSLVARRGFAVAAGTPPETTAKLARTLAAAAADPELAAQASDAGYVPVFHGPPVWDAALRRLLVKLRDPAAEIGLRATSE